MPQLRLTKLQATGNEFLVAVDLDEDFGPDVLTPEAKSDLCARSLGGADGLIRILPGRDGADLTMELANADGGLAEMSGNGARCLAWVARQENLVPARFTLATGGGVRTVEWAETTEGASARVDMGPATFEPPEIPVGVDSPFDLDVEVDGAAYAGDAAGMGNPHLVLFVDDPDQVPVAEHGPVIERDPRFPKRTNVEFVAVSGPERIRMRVWERGVGETLSCGTGACAAAAVARRRGLVGPGPAVDVRGGRLRVELGDTIWLGGPVEPVADDVVEVG